MRLTKREIGVERHERVADLAAAFGRRGPAAAGHAGDVVEALERLEAVQRPRITPDPGRSPPPRVSAAFVAAVLSEAHLRGALDEPAGFGPSRPRILGRLFPSTRSEPILQRLDRRAARQLRQERALEWMWTRFGLDRGDSARQLFRLLLPGWAGPRQAVELVRRKGQLYAIVETGGSRPIGTASLFLPWATDPERSVSPLGTFRARAVDPGLRLALGRAVGADDAELDLLLESMVCPIPREEAGGLIEEDRWRASGRAALSGLGLPYTAACWLTRRPREEEITWRRWLEVDGGGLRPSVEPRMVFDGLAARRAEVMLRQIYTGLLSGRHRRARGGQPSPDLELLDVQRHLAAVLQPLLAWPRDPVVHRRVATALGLPLAPTAEALERVADRWSRQAARVWLAVPDEAQPYTVYGVIVEHLVALHASLRQLSQPADARRDQRTPLLLFAAHHLARAPIERLWLGGLTDMPSDGTAVVPPPEDVPGAWFRACWTRLVEATEPQAAPNAPRPPT